MLPFNTFHRNRLKKILTLILSKKLNKKKEIKFLNFVKFLIQNRPSFITELFQAVEPCEKKSSELTATLNLPDSINNN